MDCILIVSASTWATIYIKRRCTLPAAVFYFSALSVKTTRLSRGGLLWLAQVRTWRRSVTSQAVTVECCIIEESAALTAQVYWTHRWINTELMKQKHVKILRGSVECFSTCGFLCCFHLYVNLCCVSHAKGQPGELGYTITSQWNIICCSWWLQNIEIEL